MDPIMQSLVLTLLARTLSSPHIVYYIVSKILLSDMYFEPDMSDGGS